MTGIPERSRRRFIVGATVVVSGLAGCIGTSDDDEGDESNDGEMEDSPSDPGADGEPTDTETGSPLGTSDGTPVTDMSPERVVEKMLRAMAAGDEETVRRLTVEGHSLSGVGKVEEITIESIERYSAREYAEREDVSVSAVRDALQQAESRGYDDATIVSYTASSEKYGRVQRDYILVLDGDQWLMYDFGRLPE